MAKGSYSMGLVGILAGVLVALQAIFIGSSSVRLTGGEHEAPAGHSEGH